MERGETTGISGLAAAVSARLEELYPEGSRDEVTRRTIRYYVAEELLPMPDGSGQSRFYGYEHYVRLLLIRMLRHEHMPLNEIRTRLSGLSLPQVEKLLRSTDRLDRVGDGEYLGRYLGGRAGDATTAAREQPATALMREVLPAADEEYSSPAASIADPNSGPWRRATLAPGVEVHYQITGDVGRIRAIERWVQGAATLLVEIEALETETPVSDDSDRSRWFHRHRQESGEEQS